MFVAVVVSAVVLYYFLAWFQFRTKYDLHKIPSPPSLPFVGHLFDFLKMPRLNYNRWTLEWAKKLGYPKVMKVTQNRSQNKAKQRCLAYASWRDDVVYL